MIAKTTETLAADTLSKALIAEVDQLLELHEDDAPRWLWAAGASFGLAGVIILTGIVTGNGSDSAAYSVGNFLHFVQKLILASLLLAFGVLCIRIYSNHVHNRLTAWHRKISILTFIDLTHLAKDDPEARSAIVKEAAKTIFAQGVTGFLGKNVKDINLPALVAEAIKSAKEP